MPLSVIHWAGGKGRQLNDLLPLIPITRIYVEPFGGGAAVLLNRPPSEIEVYNDLDEQLVNLFRVLRDHDAYRQFRRSIALTPYARSEFIRSLDVSGKCDEVEMAAAFYTKLNQSVSGKRLAGIGDWSRNRTINNADRWFARQETLGLIVHRIRNVQLECRDAIEVIQAFDGPDTTFYCDPPYILETRGGNKYYAVEPGDDWHKDLVAVLTTCTGAVVLSGYDHPIYAVLKDAGWYTDLYGQTTTMDVNTSLNGETKGRVEVVYRNPRAADYAIRRPLFHA